MKALKIRGIVGSVLVILGALVGVTTLALPMLIDTGKNYVIYTGFESIFGIQSVTDTLGKEGNLYVAAAACMVAFMVAMFALLVLGILSLISACTNKEKLSMAVSMRTITLISAIIASSASICLVMYFVVNALPRTGFGLATIVPLVFSLIAVAGAFTCPSINKYLSAKEKK